MQAINRLSSSRRVIIGISKEGLKSKRFKSNVSSIVKDESLKPKKQRSFVPKQERKAMVISYINKYRALNEGKIPGPDLIRQEVGGSFYVIREIHQELIYKYKISQSDSFFNSLENEIKNENIKVENNDDIIEGLVSVGMDSDAKAETRKVEEVKEGEKMQFDSAILQKSPEKVETKINDEFEVKKGEIVELDSVENLQKRPENFEPKISDKLKEKMGKMVELDSVEILQESPGKVVPKIRDKLKVKKVKKDSAEILQKSPEKVGEPHSSDKIEVEMGKNEKLDISENLHKSPEKVEKKMSDGFEVIKREKEKLDSAEKFDSAEILQESPERVKPKTTDEFANVEIPQREQTKSEKKHKESSEPAGNIWGNFKKLADGFINFWKKF